MRTIINTCYYCNNTLGDILLAVIFTIPVGGGYAILDLAQQLAGVGIGAIAPEITTNNKPERLITTQPAGVIADRFEHFIPRCIKIRLVAFWHIARLNRWRLDVF